MIHRQGNGNDQYVCKCSASSVIKEKQSRTKSQISTCLINVHRQDENLGLNWDMQSCQWAWPLSPLWRVLDFTRCPHTSILLLGFFLKEKDNLT